MNAHSENSNKAFRKALEHQSGGRSHEAERLLRSVLQSEPNHAAANHALGVLYAKQGKAEIAIPFFSAALNAEPQEPRHWFSLAKAFIDIGAIDQARFVLEKGGVFGVSVAPQSALSLSLKRWDLFDQAEKYYEAGRWAEAEQCYEQILASDPADVDSLHMLGVVAWRTQRFEMAVKLISEAIRLKDTVASFHCDLGIVLDSLGRFEEAIKSYTEALKLDPFGLLIHNSFGNTSLKLGRLGDAIAHFEQVLSSREIPLGTASGKISRQRSIFIQAHSNLIFALLYIADFPNIELMNRAREFGEKFAVPLLRQRQFTNVADPDRRLRIGFVSGDFRKHAVSYFFEPLLAHLDRGPLEIFGYSNAYIEDAVTVRLKDNFDHWRNIRSLDDNAAADLIEADGIDILVDLAGHSADNRLLVFACKPAPVQVTWLGFSATTGLQAIDYRITDVHAEPVGLTEHLNVETLWRLPRIFCCYQGANPAPAVIDHPPKDGTGYVTFGCFNNFAKLTEPVLALWARVLARLPDARLMLEIAGLESTSLRAEIEARLARFGLPLDRLILVPRSPANQFVLYNQIDIALDPFPSNGGTTSMDTLWMGVPLVTLAGDRFSSRMGVTILTNAGLSELIAADEAQYVEIAAALASDDGRLRSLRHNLRERVVQSPLMDQAAFARDMEAAYRGMWQIWCERQQ
jgi:protein O-GlcNAc transferase